ncbi:uncharacterized protein METZ01_LOCUS507877, partial [marine metagenome]
RPRGHPCPDHRLHPPPPPPAFPFLRPEAAEARHRHGRRGPVLQRFSTFIQRQRPQHFSLPQRPQLSARILLCRGRLRFFLLLYNARV